jgi:aminoglycoside/choline kinase family phosphotransferase
LRQRWFGATGLQVPEIAVEGELELGDALVLDDLSDEAGLRQAHEQGRAVVVRADSAEAVKAALSRPEVASVLVPAENRELLELDLTELTYGEI